MYDMHRLGARHTARPAPVVEYARLVQLPSAPTAFNWHAACNFGTPPDTLGNGQWGNCVTVAGLQRLRMITSTLWGRDSWAPDTDQALALYSANTTPPFNEADPNTDAGTDTARFMTYCATKGIVLGEQTTDVVVWCSTSLAGIREAISALGPVQVTLKLPIAAQDPTSWAMAPKTGPDWLAGSWGEHRVPVGRYETDGAGGTLLTCVTWAVEQPMHPEFVAAYMIPDSIDVAVSRTLLEPSGLTAAGMDWEAANALMRGLSA